jgi:hypothetical protein
MKTELVVPLSMSQIDAANRLHRQLSQWQVTDDALRALKERFPGFDIDATLLKVASVNQLYGTNVFAVVRMAQHVTEVMLEASIMDDVSFVVKLAELSGMKHTSFASKFAHFFIDVERFPIYDSYAVKMVAYHLGQEGKNGDIEHPYKSFVENLHKLMRCAQLSCTTRELDHYLWLAGMSRKWRANPGAHIGSEVSSLFSSQSPEVVTDLKMLCEV